MYGIKIAVIMLNRLEGPNGLFLLLFFTYLIFTEPELKVSSLRSVTSHYLKHNLVSGLQLLLAS